MAVTVATVERTPFWRTFSVIATADADTGATIAHGFGVIPQFIFFLPADPVARVSLWTLTSKSVTDIVVAKSTGVGSGGANVQLLVTALRSPAVEQ